MDGPFNLTEAGLAEAKVGETPGNFALGFTRNGQFYVQRVGRSDANLLKTVKEWMPYYRKFKFREAATAEQAFLAECRVYHAFTEEYILENEDHPVHPDKTPMACPICMKL
jgi:hypothetical protein